MAGDNISLGVKRIGRKWYAQMRLQGRLLRSDGPHKTREKAVEAVDGLEKVIQTDNWLRMLEANKAEG